MSTETDKNSLADQDKKNNSKVYCTFCPSKMLNAGAARLVNIEFNLPYVQRKRDDEVDQKELLTDFWLVEDMYTFENIGVSQTVDNVKYLACADCERGPVGWHDLTTKKSYIALSRVKHE
ncbi:PREDICTED: guanine nucleotide exchange factor MSS4 homolog [Dufourea novaeangliae]|uniref:Guanine nucleotide exchange factor MSS4 like protein n=1 Tax=Dufourea novaeangliae TaxID=178035 RepID=A0A154PF70_DUFNO|nr:PREDICTED: guanine nucleotide exchange factor MSS4 homolog [Dufourea novaeangliae]KZC10503.1 Guanine nucleotide exchange factor MSS4 like protein [Dufourea novaeangliae]